MLHNLANDGGFVALKRAAEDREGSRHRERMSKTCCIPEELATMMMVVMVILCFYKPLCIITYGLLEL